MTTQPANDIEAAVQRIMSQAQVVSSAWSLVGSRFDFGQATEDHDIQKADLEQLIRAELGRAPAASAEAARFPYDRTFRAIQAATQLESGGTAIGVSVKKFRAEWDRLAPAEPAQQAPSGQQAEGRPTDTGLFAWVPEHGTPSLVLVDRRPSAHSPGNVLNGHVIGGSTFYDGCAIASWPEKHWINLRPSITQQAAQPVAAPGWKFVAEQLFTSLDKLGNHDGYDYTAWEDAFASDAINAYKLQLAASPAPPLPQVAGKLVPLTEQELRKPWTASENEDDFSNEYQIWLSGFRRAEAIHGIGPEQEGV